MTVEVVQMPGNLVPMTGEVVPMTDEVVLLTEQVVPAMEKVVPATGPKNFQINVWTKSTGTQNKERSEINRD
uniref:Uncharacterized protein n=1 Tax=Meloidogyne enterolobii TaxID=390850 RepID=A0A6V7UJ01_MELEN|nr:unnamed protein product [Meloidogyne enterolobii]